MDDACLLLLLLCCRAVPLGPNLGGSTCHGVRKTMGGVRAPPDRIEAVSWRSPWAPRAPMPTARAPPYDYISYIYLIYILYISYLYLIYILYISYIYIIYILYISYIYLIFILYIYIYLIIIYNFTPSNGHEVGLENLDFDENLTYRHEISRRNFLEGSEHRLF